jgi:hypothetical protein
MTRYAPLWQQANSYAASLDRQLVGSLWPSGAASGAVPTASATTMQVTVPPGTVAVPLQSGQGAALCRWDANEVVTLFAGSAQQRIDLVICQVRDNALDAGANNDFIFTSVTGTPAASNPAVPALPTNALAMCQVLVPAGSVANLSGATITDRRPSSLAVPGKVTSVYNPATQTQYNVGAGVVIIDATNITVSFVAPLSGRVIVRWNATAASVTVSTLFVCMYSGGAQIGSQEQVLASSGAGTVSARSVFEQLYSGLTPGALYTFTPAAWAAGTALSYFYVGGPGALGSANSAGPSVLTVEPVS